MVSSTSIPQSNNNLNSFLFNPIHLLVSLQIKAPTSETLWVFCVFTHSFVNLLFCNTNYSSIFFTKGMGHQVLIKRVSNALSWSKSNSTSFLFNPIQLLVSQQINAPRSETLWVCCVFPHSLVSFLGENTQQGSYYS